ncbi:MAG: aminopeptidase P family protein [Clostridia bacterium]|nr:aminopeptidase P family protein [Clostridia bacterium]
MNYERKIGKVREKFEEHNIEAMLITNPTNIFYLSGFSGSAGYVLLTAEKAYLITDFRYEEQAQKEIPLHIFELVILSTKIIDKIKDLVENENIKKLGIETKYMTVDFYNELNKNLSHCNLVSVKSIIEELRIVKNEEEIIRIKKAAKIADLAFKHIVKFIKPGVKEFEVAAEIEYFMRRKGASKASFDIIAASGERAALPHGTASEKELKKGDLLVMDFGAVYKGYCSDITRTVVVGKASEEQCNIYDIVLEAQKRALQAVAVNMPCSELDSVARNIIESYGYGDKFGHSLGHGVGIEVHEPPAVSKNSTVNLSPGMVITIEPGIYIEGWGGVRIEDMVLVTEQGPQVLTTSTKELLEI